MSEVKGPVTMNGRPPETERLYWPVERMRAYQLDRLRETISQATRSSFYGPRLKGLRVDSPEDLARLPLTTKADVRSASPFGLLAVDREQLFQYHESFGTTGPPASSWLTRDDFHNYATQINHSAVNLQRGDRVLVRFPYAISVPAHIVTQAAHDRGACVIPVGSRTTISPYPRVIDLLRKLEVTVLACLPTEAIWLAETARLKGLNSRTDFRSLRAICTAGELMSNARRARISELWHAPVYNLYGCTEAGNIAADCEAGRLHLSWDHFLLEVLDPRTKQPAASGGSGTAALTTLTRQAMPLLRYLLGDYLRLHTLQDCPCGRTAPVVEHYGRDLNRFHFGERPFFVRELEERLLCSPVRAVGNLWLIEVRPKEVRFRVEAEQPDMNLYRRLEAQVREELDLPLVVDPVRPGGLLDRTRLLAVEPVHKPCNVGYVRDDAAPSLTLDSITAKGVESGLTSE